jgi:hypothetical protein
MSKIALIAITNNYENNEENKLVGVNIDKQIIEDIVDNINKKYDNKITLFRFANKIKDFIMKFISENTMLDNFDELIIIYSGHGYETDGFPSFSMMDNTVIGINEIVNTINKRTKKPKLYIIDNACRAISKKGIITDIYDYNNELLIVHPVASGELALCGRDLGSLFIFSMKECKEDISDIKKFIVATLTKYTEYIEKNHFDIHPKIYANHIFREKNKDYTNTMRTITMQTQDSIIATKIGTKKQEVDETKEVKVVKEVNIDDIYFLGSKIVKYKKMLKDYKDNYYDKIIIKVQTDSYNDIDKIRIDTVEDVLINLYKCKLLLEKDPSKDCKDLNLNINNLDLAKEKIKKYESISKHKKDIDNKIEKIESKIKLYTDKLNIIIKN